MELDLQGHRGARGLRPENTMPALAAALSIGVTTLEVDVGISEDGVVVLTHDRALNPVITRDAEGRWLDAPGPAFHALPYEALAAFDVGRIRPGSSYARAFPEQLAVDDTRVPRLEDAFALVALAGNARVRFNLEAKLSPDDPASTRAPRAFAECLVATVRRAGFEERVLIQSFDWRVLRCVRDLAPELETSCLTVQQPDLDNVQRHSKQASPWLAGIELSAHQGSIPLAVQATGAVCWAPHYRELTRADCDRARDLGLRVLVWTVNEPDAMRAMIALGVSGIVTDYPNRLRQVMNEAGFPLPAATPVGAVSPGHGTG